MNKLTFRSMFKSFKKGDQKKEKAEKRNELMAVDHSDPIVSVANLRRRTFDNGEPINPFTRTAQDFPFEEFIPADSTALTTSAMDSAVAKKQVSFANDASCGNRFAEVNGGLGLGPAVPNGIMSWFISQTFIGYQACALIAQHWLVDKACSMSGEDACRNGWELSIKGGGELSSEQHDKLKALDVEYKIMYNLAELNRFKNVFGIRIAIFEVDSEDDKYYEKPFNIDGVTEGSYKGISQVDPYWTTPLMTAESTSDPARKDFYDPEFWIISGKKYHRSHLIIARGPQPADILKPMYIFGGIPLTQRIYERVYAAERTANEAPLLATSKRTTSLHVDLDSVAANQEKFTERLQEWIEWRDNYAVKVLGKDEVMEQFDTNLSDFDSVIMNQYQLVAAIAKTPATELLGTSPKGFNATGEFELKSYNKELGSIQSHTYQPMLDRHYMLTAKSHGMNIELEAVFNPVDTPTADELAALNDKKADTDTKNVNIGSISPEEVRVRLKNDPRSGYNMLSDDAAEEEPGMSPENLAKLQTAEAKEETGNAAVATAGAPGAAAVPPPAAAGAPATPAPEEDAGSQQPVVALHEPAITSPEAGQGQRMESLLTLLVERLTAVEEHLIPEGIPPAMGNPARPRTSQPGTMGRTPTVRGAADVVPSMEPSKLPKMKLHGMLLAIENPKGTIRRGQSMSGDTWQTTMPSHYGFIKGVMGADGDELDCFVGSTFDTDQVYVVNQHDMETKEFDEHKVMLGFGDAEEARQTYMAAHDRDWDGAESMWQMDVDSFKAWMQGGCESPLNEACIGATQYRPMTQ